MAIAVRLVLARDGAWQSSDSFHYFALADAIHEHGAFESGGSQHPDLSRSPLYPTLVAATRFLVPDTATAGFLVSLLASVGAMFAIARLAGDLFGPGAKRAGLVLGAVSPVGVMALPSLPDPLLVALLLASASSIWRARDSGSFRPALEAGVWAGLATLTRAEGIAYPLAAAALAVACGGGRARLGARVRNGALILACGAAMYAPWAWYASQRLGRTMFAPGFEYVAGQRALADAIEARYWNYPGLDWTDVVLFAPTADHGGTLWTRWFETGRVPELDPRVLPASMKDASVPAATTGRGGTWLQPSRWLRRAGIVQSNLPRALRGLWSERLVTVSTLVLGVVAAIALAGSRRRQEAWFLAGVGVWASLPLASHVEYRFLFPWTGLGAVVASACWRTFATRPSIGIAVALLVGVDTLSAPRPAHGLRDDPQGLVRLVRDANLPPGPLMATRSGVPYLSGRPYRPLPVGGPEVVADALHATGSVAVVVETAADLDRRPDVGALLEDPPPPPWRIAGRIPSGTRGEYRLLVVSHEATIP
ncbi:MAG TPA: glycosyltransferase family 39 protein [Candidatus Polarisedimenticolaceae bacterium]